MIKFFRIFILALAGLYMIWMSACVRKESEVPPREKSDYTSEAEVWADSLIGTMSDAELIGQLLMPAVYSDTASIGLLRFYTDSLHTGGVMLLKGDSRSARILVDSLIGRSKVFPFVGIDAEWGLGMRLTDAPSFPRNGELPSDVDDGDMYDYGREVGRHARAVGVNIIFGPVMDVRSETGKDVIGFRSFGSDPERVGELGAAYARGLEDAGVISVAKHFPGHGGVGVDSHVGLPEVTLPRKEVENRNLKPFVEYMEAGLSGIMVGHLHFPALDSVIRPAAVSPVVVDGLLRKKMKFGGLIVTDALNMGAMSGEEFPVRDAVIAGADIILAPENTRDAVKQILEGMETGKISRENLEAKCRRILIVKFRLKNLLERKRFSPAIYLQTGETERLLGRFSRTAVQEGGIRPSSE